MRNTTQNNEARCKHKIVKSLTRLGQSKTVSHSPIESRKGESEL